MGIVQKVTYNIECHQCKTVTEKVYMIKEGSEAIETEIETYCSTCNNEVAFTVTGKVVPDADLLREFGIKPPQS